MTHRSKNSVWLILVLASVVSGQINSRNDGPNRPGSIRGTVVMPDGAPVSRAVKVTLSVMRGDVIVAYTDDQGRFELGNLPSGQYRVEVEGDHYRQFGTTVETVQVPKGGPVLVTISLKPERSTTSSPPEKTISVAMLDQKVPSAAKREFDRASKLSREGKHEESIAALRRAIAIYPEYLMARNDLGAQLLELGQLDEAALELEAAVKIDPEAFNPALNLGIVLLQQNKSSVALPHLEKALSIEPSSPAAHMFVGITCAKLGDSERGEKELRTAHDLGGKLYAQALFHLGQIYMKRGQHQLALKSFETYLDECPDAPNAAQVTELIARLR